MKYLILTLLLTGCATQPNLLPTEPVVTHKSIPDTLYRVGQCLYLVDPENHFKGNKKDAMRIEEITPTHYTYRWWVYSGEWAVGVNSMEYHKLERLPKPLEKCPDEKR
jgi:hypothetical protein